MTRPRIALIVLPLALAACNRAPAPVDNSPAATPTAATRPAAPARETEHGVPRPAPHLAMPARQTTIVDASVTQVQLSDQGDDEKQTIGMPKTAFGRHDTVYADVKTDGSAPDYSLYVKWIGPDGKTLSDYGMHVAKPGQQHVVVSLTKPDGWSPGEHRIELAINGKAQRAVIFQVR